MPSLGRRAGSATFEAHPNIALVKYWGMRDEPQGLPYNSSFSVTLSRIATRTRVRFEAGLPADAFFLNGKPQEGPALESVSRFLDFVRDRAGIRDRADVWSVNSFPTASGLASSASGFAALAGSASKAAGLSLNPRELSRLARLGSGSASRSVFGGFVEWRAGRRPDGRDCYARPVLQSEHWPALMDLVVLVRDAPEKLIRSARAMQSTVSTSPFYRERLKAVPSRLEAIREAARRRDPERLFPLVMEECDDFRRVCETTRPSLDYLTPTSRSILAEVRGINEAEGRHLAAYTHDAGAHVHVFLLRPDLQAVRRRIGAIPGVLRSIPLRPGPGLRQLSRGSG